MKELIGIDLGSRSVKMAIVRVGDAIEYFIYDTSLFYNRFGSPSSEGFRLDLEKFGVSKDAKIRATGYGRNALNIADAEIIPEIQAHARGAIFQTGLSDFTLIDLGGQDSKIIRIAGREIQDFYMNDRCAASAGRYLENMARILGLTLNELSEFFENPEPLSSTCAVFGESELVAKMAGGVEIAKLAAGVNAQIIKRFAPQLESKPPGRIVLVGGVAFNGAISKLLAAKYGVPVIIPERPQYNGVIGLIAV